MSPLEEFISNEIKKKLDDNFESWIKRNCIFGDGRDKKRIQLCTNNGKIVADIKHLQVS